MTHSVEAYARQLKALLPRGRVWLDGWKNERSLLTVAGTVAEPLTTYRVRTRIHQVMLALSEELVRVEQRGYDLVEESDPRTADELLEDWERMLGIPDEIVTEIAATVAERRLAILVKLVGRGGQNAAFFEELAELAGYVAHVYDNGGGPDVLRAGFRVGARCYGLAWVTMWPVLRAGFRAGDRCYGLEWMHTWIMYVEPPAGVALTNAQLEGYVRRAAPAHSVVIFVYL